MGAPVARFAVTSHWADMLVSSSQQLADGAQEQAASLQQTTASLEELSTVRKKLASGLHLIKLKDDTSRFPRENLILSRAMPEAGWNVHILMDTDPVRKLVTWVDIMVSVFMVLSFPSSMKCYR